MPLTRAFELLSGACLAIYRTKLRAPSPVFSFLLSLIGTSFIVYVACCVNSDDFSRGYILFPCIGTLLLIYSGTTKTFIHNGLSSNLMIFIGLISYSLYLWHWPLIVYVHYMGIKISPIIGCKILIVSIGLSFLSWKYIEYPLRFKYKFDITRSLLFFIAIPFFCLGVFCLACKRDSFGFNQVQPNVLKTINDYEGPYANAGCIDSSALSPAAEKKCSVGNLNKGNASVLIVGDSHAMALAGMLDVLLTNAHLKGYVVAQSTTPYVVQTLGDYSKKDIRIERNTLLSEMIKKNHYSHVVLGGYWNNYFDPLFKGQGSQSDKDKSYVEFTQGITQAIETIVRAGSIPVLVFDVPSLQLVRADCGFAKITAKNCYNSIEEIYKLDERMRNIIFNLKRQYPEIIFIDPRQVICQKERCVSAIKNLPLYKDKDHLNYHGSKLVGDIYLHEIGNPFIG